MLDVGIRYYMVILLVLVLMCYDENQATLPIQMVIALRFDGYTSLHRKCDYSRVRITKYFTIKDETLFYSSLTLFTFCFYIINYMAVQ